MRRNSPATRQISIQSRAPPPPPLPPPPALVPPLELAAVTVREALAGAALLPAGPVVRSLAAIEWVKLPAAALLTLKTMLHEPLTGMFALLKTTLAVPLVSDRFAPVQVVEAAGAVCKVSPLGTDSVIPDCVNANPLLLASVTVSAEFVLTSTLAGAKASVIVGAATVTVMGVTQAVALEPAEDGAEVTAPPALKLTVAVSVLPAESVTTKVSVPVPVEVTLTDGLVVPDTICTAPVALQA